MRDGGGQKHNFAPPRFCQGAAAPPAPPPESAAPDPTGHYIWKNDRPSPLRKSRVRPCPQLTVPPHYPVIVTLCVLSGSARKSSSTLPCYCHTLCALWLCPEEFLHITLLLSHFVCWLWLCPEEFLHITLLLSHFVCSLALSGRVPPHYPVIVTLCVLSGSARKSSSTLPCYCHTLCALWLCPEEFLHITLLLSHFVCSLALPGRVPPHYPVIVTLCVLSGSARKSSSTLPCYCHTLCALWLCPEEFLHITLLLSHFVCSLALSGRVPPHYPVIVTLCVLSGSVPEEFLHITLLLSHFVCSLALPGRVPPHYPVIVTLCVLSGSARKSSSTLPCYWHPLCALWLCPEEFLHITLLLSHFVCSLALSGRPEIRFGQSRLRALFAITRSDRK